MSEIRQVAFEYSEVAELLVKKHDIHEGFWGIFFEIGLTGALPAVPANKPPPVPAGSPPVPAVMLLINKIGIQKFDQPNALTVDAAKVNPVIESVAKQ